MDASSQGTLPKQGYVNVAHDDTEGYIDGVLAPGGHYAVHPRSELYRYEPDVKEAGDAPSDGGYSALRASALRLPGSTPAATVVPLGLSNESVDPEWVHKTKWNRSYQAVQDMPESAERWAQLAALAHDFVATATHYASIIVMESHLATHLRTIPPSDRLGGTAGGVKFEAGGLVFKFARDPNMGTADAPRFLFGGGSEPDMEGAAKSLGQELKGQSGYYWADVPGLCFPLMAVIDFMGFRVLAMTLLPINKSTLVYGSDSGGRIANAADVRLNKLMEKAAKYMNLAGHYVGSNQAYIHGPGDIEGHLGLDGKFYVLDYGRTFPPEAPASAAQSGSIFFELLRPELCRNFRLPLCSDAFTGFLKYDSNRQVYADQVRQATNLLMVKIIPEFADYLGGIGYEIELSGRRADLLDLTHRFHLIVELHRAGINVRHLGRLRASSTCSLVRRLLLSECLYRVIKNSLRASMRETLENLALPRTSPFLTLLVSMYNRVLSNDAQFWDVCLPEMVQLKFPHVLEGNDISAANYVRENLVPKTGAPTVLLREQADVPYIIRRLNECFGGLTPEKLNEVLHDAPDDQEFIPSDFGAYLPSVKHLGLVHFAAGRSLGLRGMKDRLTTLRNPLEVRRRLRLLSDARAALSNVLLTAPDSAATLLMLARIELFPVMYFQQNGDLSYMERALRSAMGYLDLVRRYGKREWEPSALMTEASLRYMQFATGFSREMHSSFETSLKDALALNETALDQLLHDVLREESTKGRSLVLAQLFRSRKSDSSFVFVCNQCLKVLLPVKKKPITRHQCTTCDNYDLCLECFELRVQFHDPHHEFAPISPSQHLNQVRESQRRRRETLSAVDGVSSTLARRLRVASQGLEGLDIRDLALPTAIFTVLDCTALRVLDVSGTRRVERLPPHLPNLERLNISFCKGLAADAIPPLPRLRKLIARGDTGAWRETSTFFAQLPALEAVDWLQRVFHQPFYVWAPALATLEASHVSHVGGIVSAPMLHNAQFVSADLITSVVCEDTAMSFQSFCEMEGSVDRASLSLSFELSDSEASLLARLPESAVGSPLARFLRKSSVTTAMPQTRALPKSQHALHLQSREMAVLNLHACGNITTVELHTPKLLVLNLFRVPNWRSSALEVPNLVSLFVSEWRGSASDLAWLASTLQPTLRHLYLCEVPALTGTLVAQFLRSQPRLVLANFFCSAEVCVSEKQVEVSHPLLRDISFEGWASLEEVRFGPCPKLERVILLGALRKLLDAAVLLEQLQTQCAALRSVYIPSWIHVAPDRLLALTYAGLVVLHDDPLQHWGLPEDIARGDAPYAVPAPVGGEARRRIPSTSALSVTINP